MWCCFSSCYCEFWPPAQMLQLSLKLSQYLKSLSSPWLTLVCCRVTWDVTAWVCNSLRWETITCDAFLSKAAHVWANWSDLWKRAGPTSGFVQEVMGRWFTAAVLCQGFGSSLLWAVSVGQCGHFCLHWDLFSWYLNLSNACEAACKTYCHWRSVHPWGNYTLRLNQTWCVISLSWLGRTQLCLIAVACKQWNWSWLWCNCILIGRNHDTVIVPWAKCLLKQLQNTTWAVCFLMLAKENCYTELTGGQFCLLEICPCVNSASSL